eukprot:SAG11_NODE_854_length_6864_cov_6.972087_4_plen_78_part_00
MDNKKLKFCYKWCFNTTVSGAKIMELVSVHAAHKCAFYFHAGDKTTPSELASGGAAHKRRQHVRSPGGSCKEVGLIA